MTLPREPLLYFLIVGAALFLLSGAMSEEGDHRIVVTEAERARLVSQWQAQMGRDPTPAELEALIAQWIREEIYYREAIAMGLDRDDVIIRRRLAQKLTFLTEDLAAGGAPDPVAVRDYYEEHAERYVEPSRYTFSHVYFSSDRRANAESEARNALAAMGHADPPDGDPFMLQRNYVARSERDVAELFGREFAVALASLEAGAWRGPVPSAYGWHLVKLESRQPARRLEFEEVMQRVASDLRQERRRQANEAYYESLKDRYQVIRS